jgi:hypothetical protein
MIMDDKKTHRDIQQAAKQTDGASGEQVNFEKAQGSSRNDEADLRDVARKAAKKESLVSRVGEQGRPTNKASTLSVMPQQRAFDGRDTVTAGRRISPLFAIQSRASRVPTMGLMRGLPDGNPPGNFANAVSDA